MSVLYYRGKPIDALTRDELIEALTEAAKEIERLRNQHQKDLDFIGKQIKALGLNI